VPLLAMIIDIVIVIDTTGIFTVIVLGIIITTLRTTVIMTVVDIITIVMLPIPAYTDWCRLKLKHSFHTTCVGAGQYADRTSLQQSLCSCPSSAACSACPQTMTPARYSTPWP